MKKRKLILISALSVAILLVVGFFVPLGSYTSQGCPTGMPPPTVRLHLIKGQTLKHQESLTKNDSLDPGFEAECFISTRYVQYLL